MIGAIAGDIIGSIYEHSPIKTKSFPLLTPHSRFTDDTVLTIATAESILRGVPYAVSYRTYYRRYPRAGYGYSFKKWGKSDTLLGPYGSYGNGSAMRVSPIGYAYDTIEDVLKEARLSAMATHDHVEGIKGAQAVAAAVFLARLGKTKDEMKSYLTETFDYNLERCLDDIRPGYKFDVSCQGSVPEAIISFLESTDYEDAVRNAVSLGGDCDTQACIAGAIAEAYYKSVPEGIAEETLSRLEMGDRHAQLVVVLTEFKDRFESKLPSLDTDTK